jgi:hypothetical protein
MTTQTTSQFKAHLIETNQRIINEAFPGVPEHVTRHYAKMLTFEYLVILKKYIRLLQEEQALSNASKN